MEIVKILTELSQRAGAVVRHFPPSEANKPECLYIQVNGKTYTVIIYEVHRVKEL